MEDSPYTTTVDMLEKHNCDFCAHGGNIVDSCYYVKSVTLKYFSLLPDDITTTSVGDDCYAEVKAAGKYK